MPDRDINVLIVEDQFPLRLGLCEFLSDLGFGILSAQNGEEALFLLDTEVIDVGVIDIRLPGMDGDDFIIAAHRIQPAMRFLILTGSTDYALPEALKVCGLFDEDVFYKPLDNLDVLTDAIGKILTRDKQA